MDEGIKIQKTTLMLMAGLILAVCVGGYVVYSSAPSNVSGLDAGNGQGTGGLFGGGGCGDCGGGSLTDSGSVPPATDVQPGSVAPTDIYIHAKSDGEYDVSQITVKSGEPVRLHFTADPDAGCGRALVIYGLNVQAVSKSGEEDIVDFTPAKAGTYEYNCGMRMWRPGKLVVV